jgi:hypothetical protein
MTSTVSWVPSPPGVAYTLVSLALLAPVWGLCDVGGVVVTCPERYDVLWSAVREVPASLSSVEVEHTPLPVGGLLIALAQACRADGCCGD